MHISTRLGFFAVMFILFSGTTALAQTPARKGWWKFDVPTNLMQAEPGFGSELELVGTHQAVTGPNMSNGAARIGIGSYYKMRHGITANGGGNYVNEYSLLIDFKVSALGVWHTFFQTNLTNSNDGDGFINPEGNIGVGATGYSSYAVKKNEWYRLVISVKNGSYYRYYLDGQLLLNGATQTVDGRFALENLLLVFADNDGEDAEIDCAELAIWNYPLTADEVKALGGYTHDVAPKQLLLTPYLQTPTPNSIYISWHDTSAAFTRVEYGLTAALGQTAVGSSEVIATPYRWHTVQLTGLQANTEYFYKVVSGSGSSAVYNFRTLPAQDFTGKIRFLLLSDTHSGDTTMAVKVIKAAKAKITELYGPDLHNQVNAILHSGDIVVSGYSIGQYTDQFFAPMASLSPYIPCMITPGNHEAESPYYYNYVKYDDCSLFPPPHSLNEKMWAITVVNTMIIGMNTNVCGSLQKSLLDLKLQAAENNPAIDFVFLMFHHPPITELWVEALTFDAGPNYVRNELFPIIKKYSKVQQLTYGHTHAFERGTIESNLENGDFRIVCAGGGGGDTDRWREFTNYDYPQIHISLDHYFFLLVEIDVAQKSVLTSMYSLGNASLARDTELMDQWHRKLQQPAPSPPVTFAPDQTANQVIFHTAPFNGVDSLMTVRLQVSDDSSFKKTVIDTLAHWKNVYGADADFNPIDTNAGIDLTRLAFGKSRFTTAKLFYYRVKYRDQNLKWSAWSNITAFSVPTNVEKLNQIPKAFELGQNYPNPFNPVTVIDYQLPRDCHVLIKVFDALGQELATLVNAQQPAGTHQVEFDAAGLSNGTYYYRLQAAEFEAIRRMVLVK
ncbi:metallophosphoesterase [candidate division KSB1 bacterium]|nr:metallophosphoesterase [candidate division KSB1 bacterium]